jgi:DNA-binding NtrC family response regulator
MTMKEKILIVEDEMIVAGDIRLMLEQAGYKVSGIARTVNRALEMIETERPFLVLLDILLEGVLSGIDLAIRLNTMNIPFVYLSANSNQLVMEQAKLTNPYGFIVKPFRQNDVLVNLDIARYRFGHDQEIRSLLALEDKKRKTASADKRLPDKPGEQPFQFQGIVGVSKPMQHVFTLITQVASLTTSVLILGENGTGKEGVANAIYKLSPRKGKPFIKINCAAIPVHLIESELFGHEKGSFTGAIERKIGKFEQAAGGTILLDEIGEMTPDMQVKILRVLQEKEIERVGGTGAIKVDVRVIAATNKNLEKEIGEGRFRLDLYYRLHVFPISLPALRERKEDIPLLVEHFIKFYASKNHKDVQRISAAAMLQLMEHNWPGNVRELEYLIERTILMSEGDCIDRIVIPNKLGLNNPGQAIDSTTRTMHEAEGDHIIAVLKKCNNRISGPGGAAEILNIPASTLYSKMRKLGIFRKFSH